MILALTLLSPAQAQETIDCTGLSSTCDLQNDMIPNVNTLWGSTVLTESSGKLGRRPSHIYDNLDALRTLAEDGGCTIDSWTGGTYNNGDWSLVWDVTGDASVEEGAGTFAGGPRTFMGTFDDGAGTGTIGSPDSLFDKKGRLYGSRDGGFVVGRYIRIAGRRGVTVSMNGTCPGDAAAVFNPYFKGGLTPFIGGGGGSSALIISKYLEPTSGNHKMIEIYNAGDAAQDLSLCEVRGVANAGGDWESSLSLGVGSLAPGEVMIVCNSGATLATALGDAPGACAVTSGGAPMSFNGNDMLGLYCEDLPHDIIGQFSMTSPPSWLGGGVSLGNNRVVRVDSCGGQDTDPTDVYDPSVFFMDAVGMGTVNDASTFGDASTIPVCF